MATGYLSDNWFIHSQVSKFRDSKIRQMNSQNRPHSDRDHWQSRVAPNLMRNFDAHRQREVLGGWMSQGTILYILSKGSAQLKGDANLVFMRGGVKYILSIICSPLKFPSNFYVRC